MAPIWSVLALFSVLLFQSGTLLPVSADGEIQGQEVTACQADLEACQMNSLWAVKKIFAEQQGCSTSLEGKLRRELKETKAKLRRIERNFYSLTAALPTLRAHVPEPNIIARKNDAVQFSCDTRGQAVNLCMWGRSINGERQTIAIDKDVVKAGGMTEVEGLEHFGGGLDAGECGLKIRSAKEDDFGRWSCILVTAEGRIFSGNVNVLETRIYFATLRDGIKAYSSKTAQVTTIINTTDDVIGVAYDIMRNNLYWAGAFVSDSSFKIYRSNVHGDGTVEMLMSSSEYGWLRGMEFDWRAQNLYAVSLGGHILACDGRVNRPFRCSTVLSRQGKLRGIALSPNQGTMYWTNRTNSGSSIVRSGMDGTEPTPIVENLKNPAGLTIDFHSSRLYWADYSSSAKQIQSSNLDGGDVVTVAEVSSEPYGMALLRERLYWSLNNPGTLQSSNKDGTDMQSLYTGTARIWHLAVPDWTLEQNRTNPCGENTCSGVCVLTPISYRCL